MVPAWWRAAGQHGLSSCNTRFLAAGSSACRLPALGCGRSSAVAGVSYPSVPVFSVDLSWCSGTV